MHGLFKHYYIEFYFVWSINEPILCVFLAASLLLLILIVSGFYLQHNMYFAHPQSTV